MNAGIQAEDEVIYNAKTGKWEIWLLAEARADPPIERRLLGTGRNEAEARLKRDRMHGMRAER